MVHDDGSKQNRAERDKASDDQEQTADDLEYGNDVKVMAQEKRLGEVSSQRWRRRGIGMKCKKRFEPNTTKTSPRRTRAITVAIFIPTS